MEFTSQVKTGQVQIEMCEDNGDPFIAMLHNILLEPDLCHRFFLIIALMNLGHTSLFHKGFCTVYFEKKREKRLDYDIVQKIDMHFLGK